MKLRSTNFIAFPAVVLFLAQCTSDKGFENYKQLVASELAAGKRADSIFFGIHFGMTGKEFYTYCWEMNKKGLFTDGANNTAVLYKLNHDELAFNASMNFYPEMINNKITEMSATFQYDSWAPWNKQLFADKLLPRVINLFKKWYGGNAFIKIDERGKSPVYVKVDGNRRIILGIKDEMVVKANYTDLLAEKQSKQ